LGENLGLTLEELKAQPWIAFVHPQDVEATQAQMEQLGRGVCITRFENRYRRKDGSYKWLSWTAVPFLEEGLVYAVARDVSDYKQAEEALRKVNQEARNCDRRAPNSINPNLPGLTH
jgi:PAS domain S-box-containing protein